MVFTPGERAFSLTQQYLEEVFRCEREHAEAMERLRIVYYAQLSQVPEPGSTPNNHDRLYCTCLECRAWRAAQPKSNTYPGIVLEKEKEKP